MPSVLIADDAAFMRMRCGRLLAANGFEVIEAENGKQAVELFCELHPDVVLLDITMPELDGLGALEEIIRIDPHARVAMVTALGQQRVVMKALEAGARDFVVKPYHPDRILSAVRALTS